MKMIKMILMVLVFSIPVLSITACDVGDKKVETFGEKVDEAIDDTKDAAEDVADKTKDGIEKACEKVTDKDCS
jgi:hypothetical protein